MTEIGAMPRPTQWRDASPPDPGTRRLLLSGATAGPLYVGAGLVEALTRNGFDPAHQDLSLLSNGRWGWIHITVLVVTGLLVLLGSLGIRRALAGRATAAKWGPRLLAVYGAGLSAAGLFVADPMSGFPPGTPAGRPAHVSWHGNLHFLSGAVAFLALIAACVLFAQRYAQQRQRRWSRFSLLTAVLFSVALAGIVTGSSAAPVVIGFTVAVVAAFTWLTTLSLTLRNIATDAPL
jgi:hypothetical membrane protein